MNVPLTIADFMDRAAFVYGDRIGVIDEPGAPDGSLGELTYRQIDTMAKAQAAGLDALGVGMGERVAIVSKNSARLFISFFGVSSFGRILVPINFRLGRDEIAYIVQHSGASLLLIDPELRTVLADVGCRHRFVLGESSDEQIYRHGTEPVAWEPDEQATATINYTSGTTARPKGVELTHRNCWINATTLGLHTGLSDRDVYLHTLPMFHCNGWGMPYSITGLGGRHIMLRQVDGTEVLRRIERFGVTILCGAPTVLQMILDAAQHWQGPLPGAGKVRVVVAGAPPPSRLIERVETELEWEFIQIYGLTETAPLLTVNRSRVEQDPLPSAERARRLSRAGAPALGVRLRVDDSGEILARSNVVLKGYWQQPEATSAAIQNGWFVTGDGGAFDDENHLTITDRKKDVIISGGENVSSIEVEDAIASHPEVVEVAVIGVPNKKWGETVKALVVVRADAKVTPTELIEFCRSRLAHYKCPTSVEFRKNLDRTATGKIQKYRLREPYWAEDRRRKIED